MDALDADDKLLSDGRQKAVRDIVQFVSFRDFNSGHDALGNQVTLIYVIVGVFLRFCPVSSVSIVSPSSTMMKCCVSLASSGAPSKSGLS